MQQEAHDLNYVVQIMYLPHSKLVTLRFSQIKQLEHTTVIF